MYDLHLHSLYSTDSYPWASMNNICDAAALRGIKGVCFTDHIDIGYPGCEEAPDFEKYSSEIDEMIYKYKNKLEVYKGMELGLQPHLIEENSFFSSKPDIDFIIGSIHVVNKKELYKGDFLENKSDEEGITAYFDDIKKCLSSFSDFDSFGHIDVVRRYLRNGEKAFKYNIYKDVIEEVLKALIHMGKGIEINTSGKRYGLSSYHPMTEILVLYKKLGGEIITIGSDAHKPEDLAYDFSEVLDLLKSLNYKYYCIFKKRKPVFIPL